MPFVPQNFLFSKMWDIDSCGSQIENILVFYQGKDAEVNFEPVETPPEDPGLASTGLVLRNQAPHSYDAGHSEKHNTSEDSSKSSGEKALDKKKEKQNANQSIAVKEGNKTGELKETDEVSDATAKLSSKTSKNEPVVQTVQSIRVAVEKLDKLQNLVGETVINQSRLHQLSEQIMAVDDSLGEMLSQFVEDNEKSVRELQDQILQVRMIPVGSIFTPMRRTVRDFAKLAFEKVLINSKINHTSNSY